MSQTGGVAIKGKKKRPVITTGNQNLIIKVGLESVVQDLFINKAWGARKISRYIYENRAELLKDHPEVNISELCINRYVRTQGLKRGGEPTRDAINIYRVECESLEKINMIADTIYNRIEECSRVDQEDDKYDDKLLIELTKSFRELDTRRSALVASIGTMQAKVYEWANAGETIDRIMGFVKGKDPMLHRELQEFIKQDPMLAESMCKIMKKE